MLKSILFLLFFNISVSFAQDTLRVIYYYIDTVDVEFYITDEWENEYVEVGKDKTVYWDFGYSVEGNIISDKKDYLPETYIILDYVFLKPKE